MSNVLVAGMGMDPILIGIIAVAVVILLIIIMSGYVKARPDQALIISGFRKTRTLIGRAGIKIPFLERKDTLSLALIPIDVKTSNAVPTADYININVDAAVNIKISDQKEKLELAAQNFLNKDSNYIASVAREVLEEVGLRVKNIRYYASQPWGFAGNLQIGYIADVDGSAEITLDEEELATAFFISREELEPIENRPALTQEMIEDFRTERLK